MRGKLVVPLFVTLLILCPITIANLCIDSQLCSQNKRIMDGFTASALLYTESIPVHILNNTDFANQASVNSWDGNGSMNDPYIIEELNITDSESPLIQIGNTTVFFEVRGCLLVGSSTGIFLENVTNAKVWNNTIRDSASSGILIAESVSVKVTNNSISGISGVDSTGVYFIGSNYCELSNNTIGAVSGWNILIDYSHNCSITDNYISMAGYDGIRLRDSSQNNITLNEIDNSNLSGIKLGNSHKCRIEQNVVEFSVSDGLSIEASSDCRITDNVLFESGSYSLDVAGASTDIIANTFYRSQMQGLRIQSDNNYVIQNNFIENNLLFSEFATYLVEMGTNNNINGNYYDMWTWPDENDDNIVDRAYPYSAEQNDNEPHVLVFQTDLMHILTKPRLIHPNETMTGEKFWGHTEINWSVSSDTFGHDVTYNVSVSSDGGSQWSEIAHDLTETALDWNASDFIESDEYKFKVVAQCSDGLTSEYTAGVEYEVRNHTLSAPRVLTPNGGESIFGTYDITWSEAVESWGLPVTYSVYYSQDAGDTWDELISYFEDTTFVWDIRGISDGDQYLIRVVAMSEAGLMSEDVSDSVFTISRPNITIIAVSIAGGAIAIVTVVYILRRQRRI